jgi:UDP-N-acetylmuramyl tripeptide synthase
MTAVVVCRDVHTARRRLAEGQAVVLLGHDGEALGRAAAALRKSTSGRLAVFVGDLGNEADRQAVRALAAEQFGAGSVPVSISEES